MKNLRHPPQPMTRSQLTPDQRHEIGRRYVTGEQVTDLATEYGVSTALINRTVKTYAPCAVQVGSFDWIGRQAMYPGGAA